MEHSGLLHVLEWLARRPCLLVWNYHRVSSGDVNHFDDGVISATAEGFRSQVSYLRDHFDMPSLNTVVLEPGATLEFRRPTALITFDDGYRDNFTVAMPILQELGVPATFFITTGFVDGQLLPWWDRIAYVIKKTRRRNLSLDCPERFCVNLQEVPRDQVIKRLISIYRNHAHSMDDSIFFNHLEERAQSGTMPDREEGDLFMDWHQVRQLLAAGMTIGSHTHTHPHLSSLGEEEQTREMMVSRDILKTQTGQSVLTFSYPTSRGNSFSERTKYLAREAGYQLAFSYYGGVNCSRHTDLLDIRRMPVSRDLSFALFRTRSVMLSAFRRSI